MRIIVIGIDPAKSVFAVHGSNQSGRSVRQAHTNEISSGSTRLR